MNLSLPIVDQILGRVVPWQNWGRTATARPRHVDRPSTIEAVVHVVNAARERNGTVKALGAGHSFTAIGAPRDGAILPDGQSGLVSVDVGRQRATLRAGTRLFDIPGLLEPYGLAMTNLGDIDRQTLAGAVSTGTHGTGLAFGGLATQIVGATLVTGTGQILTVGEDDPRLAGIALGLGALGVLVEITLQCVDRFVLEAVDARAPLAPTIDDFVHNARSADHFEFYWFPGTEVALTKTNTRHPADYKRKPLGGIRHIIEDEIVGNGALLAMCEAGRAAPSLTPHLVSLATSLTGSRTVTDFSDRVFTSDRSVRFRETEWSLPLENTMPAFAAVRSLVDTRDFNLTFPIEVRAAAADNLMLSTASGRESGYIAAHRYFRDRADDFFVEVERIMIDHGARPHWGKMHTRSAEFFRQAYPRFDEFAALRDELDPDRVFANDYLDTVLGE